MYNRIGKVLFNDVFTCIIANIDKYRNWFDEIGLEAAYEWACDLSNLWIYHNIIYTPRV